MGQELILLLLFFISGALGLIYETLWIRTLSLGVGSTSASMSLVLSIFFLGLSFGSYFAGRFANRLRNPLRTYALIECLVGLYALLIFPFLFDLHRWITFLSPQDSISAVALLIKLVLVSLLLLPPTLAMGATLPLLVRFFVDDNKSADRRTSLLYGINTLGAAAGALFAGFHFIPQFGMATTNTITVLSNVGLAAVALFLSFKTRQASSEQAFQFDHSIPSINRKQILVICTVSGFASISSEVIWNKYLGIFFGTNIYGLGLILSLYLLGMGVGSLLLTLLSPSFERRKQLFIPTFLFAMATLLLASYLIQFGPALSSQIVSVTSGKVGLLLAKSLYVGILLFPSTCAFGALLPLGISLLSRNYQDSAKSVGTTYALNTVGAIVGAYVTGILSIPYLGSSISLKAVIVIAAATLLLFKVGTIQRTIAASLALLAILLPALNFQSVLRSAYHIPESKRESGHRAEEFKKIIEGETAIISLSQDPRDGAYYKNYLRLKTNGLNESVYDTIRPGILPRYEALIALLPYLYSDKTEKAFIVGYGGGYTADLLTSLDIPKVHIVELEKGILTAADYVHKGKNPILQRKNATFLIEDARYVLATEKFGKQDLIISQPSHSWLAGAANLFTQEFFEIVKGQLTENGIFSQWLNLYNMDSVALNSILRTFFQTFPEGAVFTNGGDQELVLIGSRKPLKLREAKLDAMLKNPLLVTKLSGVPIRNQYDFLTHYSFSREKAVEISKEAPLNTDRNAFAETRQSRIFYEGSKEPMTPQQYLSQFYEPQRSEELDTYYFLLQAMDSETQYDKFDKLLRVYEAIAGGSAQSQWKLGYLCQKNQRLASALRYLKRASQNISNPDLLNSLLFTQIQLHQYGDALLTAKKIQKPNQVTQCYLADLQLRLKKPEINQSFVPLLANSAGYYAACGDYYNKLVGNYYLFMGNISSAIAYLEAYTQSYPHDAEVLQSLAKATQSPSWSEYAESESRRQQKQFADFASYFRRSGLEADALALEKMSTPLAE